MESPEEVYEKFVNFCSISLKGENPKFLDLIKSRYDGCDDDFRSSNKMILLLERTKKNMSDEKSRKFVHLKDLLTELKINAPVKRKKKAKKRKLPTALEVEIEHVEKIKKFKGCSVLMDKFPHSDVSLLDQNISSVESADSSELYPRKTCSITDGNFNSAPCIAIANDNQMDNLRKNFGSRLHSFFGSSFSPTLNWDSSLSGRAHSSDRTTVTINHNDSDAPILHISHNTNDSKEKSHRKSVSILGVHNITEDGCIKTGTLCDSSSVYNLPIIHKHDQESLNCQAQDDNGHISKNELKTSKKELTFQIMDTKTELPRKNQVILDVEMSNSTELLTIEPSSFCKMYLEEYPNTKDDHRVHSPVGCLHKALVKSVVSSTQSSCLETENFCTVQLDAKSENIGALSSPISGEKSLQIESGNVAENISLHTPLVATQSSSLSCIHTCVPISVTSLENEITLNHDSLINDQEILEKQQTIHHDSSRKDTSTLGIKSWEDKLPKRGFLLSSSKIDTYTSSWLFGVKKYSQGSQQETTQEPMLSNTGDKTSSSWMEAETLDHEASTNELQESEEHSTCLNKRRQKRVVKLERLLASLRNEIEKCQETEISLEDLGNENTVYMYEDKLKRKFVAVWNKLCEVTERSVTTGRPTEKTIKYNGTRYKEINHRIQKFLNKKKMFPDFHDIKSIVKLTNKKCNLNLSSMMINDVAREAFVDIGEMLQARRHQDFISTFGTRQTDTLQGNVDPYLTDPELRRKVDSNRQVAKLNLDSVITKYTQLQYDRNCGEGNEEGDDKTEEEIVKSVCTHHETDQIENHKEKICPYFEDFVTTASIEVDMAEEGNDNHIDYRTSDAQSIHQQASTSCSSKVGHLEQMSDFLTSENDKPTIDKLGSNSNVPALGHQMFEMPNCKEKCDLVALFSEKEKADRRMDANNTITFQESLVAPWKAANFKDSFQCWSTKTINVESSNNQSIMLRASKSERRGPAIKYTARKLSPNSGLAQNSEKIEYLTASDIIKKSVPYNRVQSKINTDIDISDEDDKSHDSASEKDADDKNVEIDVNEIVMIINRSESECDATSTRDPSPISIVSLSSNSLTDDDGRSLGNKNSSVKVCTNKKHIASSPNSFSESCQMPKESDSLEKRLFLHAMGITESENEVTASSDFIYEKICTFGKDDNVVLNKATEDKTTSNQTDRMFTLKIGTEINKQHTAEKECIIVQDSSLTSKKAVNQDDCIIIDMPGNTSQLTVVFEKVSTDKEVAVCTFANITATSRDHTRGAETEKKRSCIQFSAERSSSAFNSFKNSVVDDTSSSKSCTFTVENDQEMNKRCAVTRNRAIKKINSDVPLTRQIDNSNILTSSTQANVENLESNFFISNICHSNIRSSCNKDMDTINLDKTTCWKYCSDAEKNQVLVDLAEPSLKPINNIVGNEDVIILDDISVHHSLSQESSIYPRRPLPQSELPLNKVETSFVEKHSSIIEEKRILTFPPYIKDVNKSFKDMTDMFEEDIKDIDEIGHKSQFILKGVHKSDEMTKISSVIKNVLLERSESNQLLFESVVENVKIDEKIGSNPEDILDSSSQLTEQMLRTAVTDITAEKDQESVSGKGSSIAICFKDAETNRASPISEHCLCASDTNVNGTCVTGDIGVSLKEEIDISPRKGLNNIDSAEGINLQNTMKTQKNICLDLFKVSSVIDTATSKDNEIGKEPIQDIQPAVNYSVCIDSVQSEMANECPDIGSFKDQNMSIEKQELHDVTQSTCSYCDMAVITVFQETYSSDTEQQPECQISKEEESLDKFVYDKDLSIVNAESIKDVQKYKMCDKTDSIKTSLDFEHCNNRINSNVPMVSEKVTAACNNFGNESGNVLCITNVRSVQELVLSNQVIYMKTLTNENVDGQYSDNINSTVICAGKHILMDDSIGDAMKVESEQQKIEVSKSDTNAKEFEYEKDSVNFISVDSSNIETILDDKITSILQSADNVRTKLRRSENTSVCIYNLSRENEKHGHPSDWIIQKKGALVEDHSTSLVISGSQSSINKDTVAVEVEGNCDVHLENIISVTECGEAFVDISRDKVSSSEDREDVTNIREGRYARHGMVDNSDKENAIISSNSVTCDMMVRKMNADSGREKVQEILSINKFTESLRLAEITSDEDEIKVIEELSSVKGVRTSENSKEDDRKLVDQLILNIGINQTKGIKCPCESIAIVIPACQMSEECWDISENVDTEENSDGHGNLVKKTLYEKTEASQSTYSPQYRSVMCEEVNTHGGKVLPLLVSASCSQTKSPVDLQSGTRSRKRYKVKSFSSNCIIHDSGETNNGEDEQTTSCVIDVEMLLQPDRQKVMKSDLNTKVISTVLSELPLGSKTDKTFKFVTENTSLLRNSKFPMSKNSQEDGVDDDVVIMEETHSKITHPILHKGKNITSKTSAAIKKRVFPHANPFLVKKHEMPHGNANTNMEFTPPTSSHYKNISSQPLPRLMPRVPIPSIQYNKTSEPARTYLNDNSSRTSYNSFCDRQSQSLGYIKSSPNGRSETMSKPQAHSTSLHRKKSLTPVMVCPDGRGRSELTSYNTDTLNTQSPSIRSGSSLRYESTSSLSPKCASVRCDTIIDTDRCTNNQMRNVDGMEIILGDSDDDSEFNYLSSGPRIVSVASLTSTQSNTLPTDLRNVPNTKVRNCKDIIIIPD